MLVHLPGELSAGGSWPAGSPTELTASSPTDVWTLPRLLTAFNLLTPGAGEPAWRQVASGSLKPAAVLIPVIVRDSQLSVLFTRRSAQLRHHPGQISFPGGRQDPEDRDLATTALRETHEELGIPARYIQLLGELPAHITVSHYRMVPFIGLLAPNYPLIPAADEVAEAFELPLTPLLDPANYGRWQVQRGSQRHTVFGITLQQRLVWGATARILWQLACQLNTAE